MHRSIIYMYKSAKRTAGLRIESDHVNYDLRHLFSGAEIYRPTQRKKILRHEHAHNVYHVVLYIRGKGEFDYCGRTIAFEPGVLAVTAPGQTHMFGPYEPTDEEIEYWNYTFDMVDADNLALELSFAELLARWWGVSTGELDLTPRLLTTMEFQEMRTALNASMVLTDACESFPLPHETPTVLNLLAKLLHIFSRKEQQSRQRKADLRLRQAQTMIENDLQGRQTIADLAHAVGMSRAHFLRRFKAEFGVTPMHYSRHRRLSHALNLLESGENSFKEVAERVGFCDEFHFSKAFKAEFGESPSTFLHRSANFRV